VHPQDPRTHPGPGRGHHQRRLPQGLQSVERRDPAHVHAPHGRRGRHHDQLRSQRYARTAAKVEGVVTNTCCMPLQSSGANLGSNGPDYVIAEVLGGVGTYRARAGNQKLLGSCNLFPGDIRSHEEN